MSESMTYAGVGVEYEVMDPFKRMAQLAARETAFQLERFGYREVEWSHGESCYLYETPTAYRGRVNEGLGTKNMVADAMYQLTGSSYYHAIAQDTIAAIVNDMITVGCLPITVDMHVAAGSSDWFKNEQRCTDLIAGWKDGCNLARCTWAGGETPTLKGMIESSTVILSGSADGEIKPKSRVINPATIQHGDAIIFIESSGIHANGLTIAREIADKLPDGYLTKLSDGRTYGETLLDPTHIYVPLIEDCLNCGVDIHYAVNITGHGWAKLMRATQPFAYIIDHLPTQLPIFDFLQKHGPIDDEEAYGNLNMGVGFALYMPEADVKKVWNVLESYEQPNRFSAVYAGHVQRSTEKKVVVMPKGRLTLRSLNIR